MLALGTALTQRGIALNSSYLADLSPAAVAVSHLLTGPGRAPRFWQQLAELTGTSLERACLLDHAAALQEHLAELWGEQVGVRITDTALAHAAGVWAATGR